MVGADATPTVTPPLVALAGDHPLPGLRSLAAAQALADECARVRSGDHALVLLSGGASSLVAAPVAPLSAHDLVALFDLLHRAGLDIHAMNLVRKRVVQWGAGRLALALARSGARVDALLVSDVPGDDPADVASGPCTPDPSTAAEIRALLREADLLARAPAVLVALLDDVERGAADETPKPGHPAFDAVTTRVIGSNALAVAAAVARARALGLHADADPHRCGARRHDAAWRSPTRCSRAPTPDARAAWCGAARRRCAATAAGPPTARGRGSAAAARSSPSRRPSASRARAMPERRVTLLAAGTDGRDGPTDAAGAFADAALWDAIARAGHDPALALARHDAHPALDAAGALLRAGPTGTNVMDVVIGVVR